MCLNNIDNVQYNGEFKIKFGLAFRCSECIEERMNNELPHTYNLFDTESECKDEAIDVKDRSNQNDDNDSNVVIFNESGEEGEAKIHDNTDNTISDNNEDEKYKKEDNIIEKSNVPQKMSVLSVVYEARFLKQI